MKLTKKKITYIVILSFLSAAIFLAFESVYTVAEGHTALLEKVNVSNTPVQQAGPGLHISVPFFVRPEQIDLRLHSDSFTAESNLLTKDKHPLLIDYYAEWKVTDPILFYKKTQNNSAEVQQALTQIINPLLKNECADNTLDDMISDSRVAIQAIQTQANKQLNAIGISLVDVGFTSIHFPTEDSNTLLDKRRVEQSQIALELRTAGKANADNIRLVADNAAALDLAKATEQAALIRAQGDAQAAKLYNAAYQKNPKFAAFYLNLEAYQKGFTQSSINNNFLVLNTNDTLFNGKENARTQS